MKTSKKVLMTILAITMAMSMTMWLGACGSNENSENGTGMENPVNECASADELCETTGLAIDAPEGATNVAYAYIDAADEDGEPIAQVTFTMDGQDYCYRCQSTSETDIFAGISDENASVEDLTEKAKSQTDAVSALSGMYYEWKSVGQIMIADRDGMFGINKGKEGFVAWLDVVPGVMYSLSVEKGADEQMLIEMAEKCFVPMQGETDEE